ncbi:OmpA family protein [Dyella japonica]|uniref:OmpA-like domain-containing protein n=1 Tax=Dyella japonica TaxID=231455 RepID=A0ABV2JUR9_9GAMM
MAIKLSALSSIVVALILITLVNSCHADDAIDSPPNLSIDFKTIYFPVRRPYPYESYLDMDRILDKEGRQTLWELLDALNRYPIIGAKVYGYADVEECEPSECQNLSLRQAIAVYEWFLNHGVHPAQLGTPIGESINYPLYRDGSEEGKAFNRRVQLEPIDVPTQEKLGEFNLEAHHPPA